jgi:hypothetical protein
MPQTSSNKSQPVTRAKNANTHPGEPDVVAKRKRRTKAEIAADNKAAAEAKAAVEAKKQAGMKKIANLEKKIDEDNSNDVTPKPKATYKPRPLRRTSSHLFIPLDNSAPDFSEPVTEQTGTEDEYQQPTERETDTDIEFEEDLAPPKKKKKVKGQVREAIKAAGKEITVREEGMPKGKQPVDARVNREAGHGTSSHAIGLVFPFSSNLRYQCSPLIIPHFFISRLIAIPSPSKRA